MYSHVFNDHYYIPTCLNRFFKNCIVFFIIVQLCFCFTTGEYHVPCETTSSCQLVIEDSVCMNGVCQCKIDHFLGQENNRTICISCPGQGEDCSAVECCRHSAYLTCSEGYCRCRNTYDGYYCWNTNLVATPQFESIAQIILGLALVFTIAILASLVWRLCSRQEIVQPNVHHVSLHRETSFASLNSVQRLVLIRLQDRPPPYDDTHTHTGCHPWKSFNNFLTGGCIHNQNIPSDPPPPYTVTLTTEPPTSVPLSQTQSPSVGQSETTSESGGIDNPVFNNDQDDAHLHLASTSHVTQNHTEMTVTHSTNQTDRNCETNVSSDYHSTVDCENNQHNHCETTTIVNQQTVVIDTQC